MMIEEENTGKTASIACSYCGHKFEVELLQISNHAQVSCPSCGKLNDMAAYDQEAQRIARKNQKELNKLRKLRGH